MGYKRHAQLLHLLVVRSWEASSFFISRLEELEPIKIVIMAAVYRALTLCRALTCSI